MQLLNFLSGLLLALLVLGTLLYVLKEVAGFGSPGGSGKIREVWARYFQGEAKPVNDHLIGSTGEVVAHSEDEACPFRIRVGPEYWPARLDSSTRDGLPVGAAVKVSAVDGPVLVVEAGERPGADRDATPGAPPP